MKSLAKKLITSAARNNFVWSLLERSIVPVANYAQFARKYGLQLEVVPKFIHDHLNDLVVHHGPFAGMTYPSLSMVSSGSSGGIIPKLLGSYERELHPTIEKICGSDYTDIVDVGCAEGYYAVGLAMRLPNTRVLAFDTNKRARHYCTALATRNGVQERVIVGEFCDGSALARMPFSRRALIFSDCEGYEATLFSEEAVGRLANHDVLIEVHDYLDITIPLVLRERFANTHDVHTIESINDLKKPYLYEYPELAGFSVAQKHALLLEGRQPVQQWFFCVGRG
jgi:hypothetical protein